MVEKVEGRKVEWWKGEKVERWKVERLNGGKVETCLEGKSLKLKGLAGNGQSLNGGQDSGVPFTNRDPAFELWFPNGDVIKVNGQKQFPADGSPVILEHG